MMMMNDRHLTSNDTNNNGSFICGVVEGFYGKPWSWEQRKELFKRLKDFKLNSFMYAPKDDTKHRAKWRQPYSEFEANELRTLIREAKAHNIDFYYSLSPGLDMIYSDREELELLFRKYDQLASLGCESFAILFDDIEPTINDIDKTTFKNYAHAQVHVTNAVYEHLNRPKFIFCPTEYCESRASPSVANSVYLNTIGVGLQNSIDIMWSGSRVISRYITEESIDALTRVIRRPPLIWENLHANDYDKRRVFLGPYSGRSTKIISKLRGVLTNPNCEYEANYIAIHTLAQWSHCNEDVNHSDRFISEKLSAELEDKSDNPNLKSTNIDNSKSRIYDPQQALVMAIRDWLPKILEKRAIPPSLNLSTQMNQDTRSDEAACSQLDPLLAGNKEGDSNEVDESNHVDMVHEETSPHSASSISTKSNKSEMDITGSPIRPTNNDNNSCDSCTMQEDIVESESSPVNEQASEKPNSTDLSCLVSSSSSEPDRTLSQSESKSDRNHEEGMALVNFENLSLLVDLYYLPFEHGINGINLLNDIKWLKDNSRILIGKNLQDEKCNHSEYQQQLRQCEHKETTDLQSRETKMTDDDNDDASEPQSNDPDLKAITFWIERAKKLNELCACIGRLVNTLIYDCPNKLFIIELYPYLCEIRDTMVLIMDYIKFLRYRTSSTDRFYNSNANPNKPARDQQVNIPICDDEPWVHRGGLIGDVQRLLS